MTCALLVATGYGADLEHALLERVPLALLPLAGRPFVHHAVEALVAGGCRSIHVVLGRGAELVEEQLGDGRRWGCSFAYHLATDEAHELEVVRLAAPGLGEASVVLARADTLPLGGWPPGDEAPCLVACPDGAGTPLPAEWTGWGVVAAAALRTLPRRPDRATFLAYVAGGSPGSWRRCHRLLRAWPLDRLVAANREVLTGHGLGLMVPVPEVEPGVWIGRNVSLHPTATVQGPVFLGDHVAVGRNARVGPDAVVGACTVLDEGAVVAGAVVGSNTFVGAGLEVREAVVEGTTLASLRTGSVITVRDAFLLGDLGDASFRRFLLSLPERGLAALLALLTLPLLLVAAALLAVGRRGPVLRRRRFVPLPAPLDRPAWRTADLVTFGVADVATNERTPAERLVAALGLDSLPALGRVATGDLHFVGLNPRGPEELAALPPDWRASVLRGRAGLVTLAAVQHGSAATPEEVRSAESYYAVRRSARGDAGLALAWLLNRGRAPAAAPGPEARPSS